MKICSRWPWRKPASRDSIFERPIARSESTRVIGAIERKKDYGAIRRALDDGEIDVLGATASCWLREDFERAVDLLIVDEAGQMSLGNVLAAAPGGKALILLGEPQQLEQPLKSSHPEGSEVSALYHLLAGEDTMPSDKA